MESQPASSRMSIRSVTRPACDGQRPGHAERHAAGDREPPDPPAEPGSPVISIRRCRSVVDVDRHGHPRAVGPAAAGTTPPARRVLGEQRKPDPEQTSSSCSTLIRAGRKFTSKSAPSPVADVEDPVLAEEPLVEGVPGNGVMTVSWTSNGCVSSTNRWTASKTSGPSPSIPRTKQAFTAMPFDCSRSIVRGSSHRPSPFPVPPELDAVEARRRRALEPDQHLLAGVRDHPDELGSSETPTSVSVNHGIPSFPRVSTSARGAGRRTCCRRRAR